jgi:hypothetical protein|nr:MAG TPA: central spike protein [Caudoviricetes sp.]
MPISASQYALGVSSGVPNQFGTGQFNRNVKRFRAVVADNYNPKNGNIIKVNITDLFPLMKGHITDNPIPMKVKYKDALGREVISTGTHNNNIECIYFSTDTYRKTPPDVQRGEQVWVWQQGDGKWYWEPCNKDSLSSRRLETVVQAVNADKPTGKDSGQFGADNTYYTEVSSHNKTYTISTSAANGEVTSYLFQINGEKGSMILQDGMGNFVEINSAAGKVWMKNQNGCMFKMEKNNIEVKAIDNYNLNVGKDYTIEVGGNMTIKVGGNMNVDIGGSHSHKVGGTTTVDCSSTTFTGEVNIQKGLNVSGKSSLGGGGSVTGNLDISSNLSASGPVSFPAGGRSGWIRGSGD